MNVTKTKKPERTNLTWPERVNMLSVNPDAATREDVANMAADIQDFIRLLVDIEELRVGCAMSISEGDKEKKCDLLHGWCELVRMKFREREVTYEGSK